MTDQNWILVDEVLGSLNANLVAGLLRSYNIPVYIDTDLTSSIFLGDLSIPARVFVPEAYYEQAVRLLDDDEDDDLPALDEPAIKL
jgi:hypothetical protein